MANTLEYNGYIGSVEYSSEDRCFWGKLEMIDDLVTFEASSVDELEANFQSSVNEYIETCQMLGREPQKVYKGVFNVRIPPKLHQEAYKKALSMGISLNALVQQSLSHELARSN